jgi:hypothetical protein
MFDHHEAAIARVVDKYSADPSILAIVLGGSIAHGSETASSDVDVMLMVSDHELADRNARFATTFSDTELAGYEGGYIDAKYISPGFVIEVGARGTEPSRFAFAGARVLFSRLDWIEAEIERAGAYPLAGREDRIARFAAQLEAWRWMSGEGEKKNDPYLLATASSRVVLFAGRLLLAHNQLLYPFHKWFLRVLETADDKPEGIVEQMRELTAHPSAAAAEALADRVLAFREWERGSVHWPNYFILDTEQSWMRDAAAIEDL